MRRIFGGVAPTPSDRRDSELHRLVGLWGSARCLVAQSADTSRIGANRTLRVLLTRPCAHMP
jgi:hypothetical protein